MRTALLLVTALVAAAAPAAELGGSVSTIEGRPIAGARVEAWTSDEQPLAQTTSGADGRFTLAFDGEAKGTIVRATAEGRGAAFVRADGKAALSFALEAGHELDVRVTGSGRSIERALVTATASDPWWPACARPRATTDANGRVHFVGLAPDVYWVMAVADEWQAGRLACVRVGLAGTGAGTVELKLEPGAIVTGTVVDAQGAPLRGVEIAAGTASVRSDDAGSFRLGGLSPDGLFLGAELDGYRPLLEEVPVTADRHVGPLALVLEREISATVNARILLPDHTPYSGPAAIRTFGLRDPVRVEITAGTLQFRAPIEATEFTVDVDQFLPLTREGLRLTSDAPFDAGSLTLEPGRTCRGRIVTRDGVPVPGAMVRDLGVQYEAHATSDGSFVLGGLPDDEPGECRLLVSADGFTERVVAQPRDGGAPIVLQRTGSIEGRVVTGRPVQPLRGATVEVRPHETGTVARDPGGRFRIPIDAGRYTVRVLVPGFVTARVEAVAVHPGQKTDLGDVALVRGVSIAGVVLDARTGAPLSGARVAVDRLPQVRDEKHAPQGGDETESGAEGRFTLTGIAPGRHVLFVDEDGRALAEVDVDAGPITPEVTVRLAGLGALAGTARRADGSPCGECDLAFIGKQVLHGATETDGTYRIDGMPPGRYGLLLLPQSEGPPGPISIVGVDIVGDATTTLNLPRGGELAISGTVTRNGAPVAARLGFFDGASGGGVPEFCSAASGPDGSFRVQLPRAGAYTVGVHVLTAGEDNDPFGNFEIRLPVEVLPNARLDLAVPEGEITGRVLEAGTGAPVGATISARRVGDTGTFMPAFTITTDEDGRFVVPGLASGEYELWVTAPEFASRVERIALDASRPRRIDVKLAGPRSLKLRIADELDVPVEGADVVYAALLQGGTHANTDVDGLATFSDAPDVRVDLVALADGFAPAFAYGLGATGPDAPPHPLVLSHGGGLEVTVVDGAGKRVEGAAVHLVPAGRFDVAPIFRELGVSTMQTASDGTLQLRRLAPGDYEVSAGDARRRVTVTAGTTREVPLRLP